MAVNTRTEAQTAGPQTAFSPVQLYLPPEQRLHSILNQIWGYDSCYVTFLLNSL